MRSAAAVLLGLIVTITVGSPLSGQAPPTPCPFVTTPLSGPPAIIAPDELKNRVHVIAQPGSPIEIVSADFTGSRLTIEEGPMFRDWGYQQKAVFVVRNRSDQPIGRVDIGARAGACYDAGPRPPQLRPLRLLPGETGRLESSGATFSGRGDLKALPLMVWTWIERVDFASCIHQPVREMPEDLCAAERRSRGGR